ncbi:hypothetical protein MANES_02G221020v8 [Manihot esculenta]|uniref:Uncharacterized protein n=1 Tax=Manihot esculenta TaxID=3983 RepID=A0ACB7I8I4_MANES|nr:hypothetical protein MANES_02G221020v8 [Manihot esculenta]
MTRSEHRDTLPFDPEIERTLRRLRKQAAEASSEATEFGQQAAPMAEPQAPAAAHDGHAVQGQLIQENPANRPQEQRERTMRELATPIGDYAPLCITYPPLTVPFELKSGLIHHLPKFRGLQNENPHKHLKEFKIICSSMRPQGISEDHVKLRAFPFSLDDHAKDWLFYLPPGSITSWDDMVQAFLDKYFPPSKSIGIIREITSIRQKPSEDLYDYWERFERLCTGCPQHDMTDRALIEFFYGGLSPSERKFIDVACGGSIKDKTPRQLRELISTLAASSRQYGEEKQLQRANEVNSTIVSDLTSVMKSFAIELAQQMRAPQPSRPCGICSYVGHPTDQCPTLQEDHHQANAIGRYNNQPRYDPYSNTYNPGWRDHPNFSYGKGNSDQNHQSYQRSQVQPTPPMDTNNEVMKTLQMMQQQMGQMAIAINRLEAQGKLPSQTEENPKLNVSAITLRSGKELQDTRCEEERQVAPKLAPSETLARQPEASPTPSAAPPAQKAEQKVRFQIPPPFPKRFERTQKEKEEKEILETFRKVEINIPLLDAVKQIPRYAKFLKELCTNRRKLAEREKVSVGEVVTAVIKRELPTKCKDKGMFAISCKIGNVGIKKAMCDLGASINVMPLSIYKSLNACALKETKVVIQLADRSVVYPIGVLEDVLVQVNELVFPADFYVIDTKEDSCNTSSDILLGRPFLSTARTKIDVHDGTLTMEFEGEVIKYNVYDAMKYPHDMSPVYGLDIVDCLSQEIFDENQDDILNSDFCRDTDQVQIESQKEPKLKETVCSIQQVVCSQAQIGENSIAPLQNGVQILPAQKEEPESLSGMSFQLPTQINSSSSPLQSSLSQKEIPESTLAPPPLQSSKEQHLSESEECKHDLLEQIFLAQSDEPWYADMVNYLATDLVLGVNKLEI